MFGAVHYGLLAACMVLFVPMGMAGWHLSRNKMLFFSGALFITLAVCVHLTPYFPSISDIVTSVTSVVMLDSRDSCIALLPEIVWDVKPVKELEHADKYNSLNYYKESWRWARTMPILDCGFQKFGWLDATDLLNGSWVVVAGDSQARMVALFLLNLVLDSKRMESVKSDLFKRHSDYHIAVYESGLKVDFVWAPYATNLTALITEYKRDEIYPDVLVMGSGLWHMLHVTNSSNYGVTLQQLRDSVVSLLPYSPKLGANGSVTGSISIRSPHLFWLGMPMLINGMLNTEEKREKMTDDIWHAYDSELHKSKLLRKSGGPFLLLDIQSLSWNCGPHCTVDGMHYDGAVYEAAVHTMLNALLIDSHQKL